MVTIPVYQYEDEYLSDYTMESRHKILHVEMSDYPPFLENNDFFVEGLNDNFFAETILYELLKGKDERLKKRSPKMLPTELLENYQRMQEASEKNPLKILDTVEEQLLYIKKMEKVWNRSTQQHIRYMQSKDFEGNVDERTWYRLALQLKKAGVLKDLEV